MGDWIKCSEREPYELASVVVCYGHMKEITIAFKESGNYISDGKVICAEMVTHWQPCPSPPEEA
ncbi:DUF551 domain-containing protein [Pantoea brenneri]|uniref:DUF551 domain-containing protein n=1 Tax=Pantoea brenneri TaxID=472694 RepID=UPI00090802D0